jgi:hypothetical protein
MRETSWKRFTLGRRVDLVAEDQELRYTRLKPASIAGGRDRRAHQRY